MPVIGQGQFAGQLHPQDLGLSARRGLLAPSLASPAGPRLARSRAAYASKTYTGTALAPQQFTRPPAGPNTETSIEVPALKRNRSRALGQMRGFPYMAQPDA